VSNKDFFFSQTQSSEIKTEIVRKYFVAWARVMMNAVARRGQTKIGYVDLFAGKGRYEDGSKSTPILILEKAIQDKRIGEMLVCVFNDANKKNAIALKREIDSLAGVESLAYQPRVFNAKVDDNIVDRFEQTSTIPTLYFLDPFGYNGLSLRLIKAVLAPFGCDCIFFFNYNRINAALSNPVFTENMNLFFGQARANRLRANLTGRSPDEREKLIVEELKRALSELGGKYNVDYCFKDLSGHKTSHFLILTSKKPAAERIMKEIMARESSAVEHGFASFEYNPLDHLKEPQPVQASLFGQLDPKEELALKLLASFAGRTVKMVEIYHEHSLGKRYTLKNYKDAIIKLDSEGRVHTNPTAEKRLKGGQMTLGDNVMVTFPIQGEKNGLKVNH
jgi:three-Cys-motif partner protein